MILYSHQQYMRILVSPHLCQHFYCPYIYFFNFSHSGRCKMLHLLKTNDVEPLFLCLLAMCVSSLEKCLVRTTDSLRHDNLFRQPSPPRKTVGHRADSFPALVSLASSNISQKPLSGKGEGLDQNQGLQSSLSTLKFLQFS